MVRGARAAALSELPWRGPGEGRPGELPLPPRSLPLLGPRRRLRKRWRYVAAFSEELMLCAASAQVGPAGQTFWAIVERGSGEMWERTRKRLPLSRGEVWSEAPDGSRWPLGSDQPGVLTRIESPRRGVSAELRIGSGRWVESVCPAIGPREKGYVWTRKRLAPIACTVRLPDGRELEIGATGIEDESAGYHPRHTVWQWSAGIGTSVDGRQLGWNLVSGVNDPARSSERAIWVDGEPFEPGPVSFEADLGGIGFDDGSRLEFMAEAERRAEENLGLVRFSYRQPFGSFTGSLPDGLELDAGLGVMEHHDALW